MQSAERKPKSSRGSEIPTRRLHLAIVWAVGSALLWMSAGCKLGQQPETCGTCGTDAAGDDLGADGGEDGGDVSTGKSQVAVDEWATIDSAAEDPLASHRPSNVDCPDSAHAQEPLNDEPTYSIKTNDCNYFAGEQTLKAGISKGEALKVRVWHFALTGSSGKAHVALVVDGDTVWEERVPIPQNSGGLLSKTWEAQSSYDAGDRVVFHLHNHGDNTWNFIEFSGEQE